MDGEVWTIRRCLEWTTGYLERHHEEHPRVAAEWLLCAATGIRQRVGLYLSFDRQLTPDELAVMRQGIQRRAAGEPLQYIVGETSFRTLAITCRPGVLIPRPETEMLVDIVLDYLDHDVLGAPSGAQGRPKVTLPWNFEVEKALERDRARAQDAPGSESEAGTAEPAGDEEVFGRIAPDEYDGEGLEAAAPELDAPPSEPEEPVRAHVLEVGCGTGCISLSLAAERPGRIGCIATDIAPTAVELARDNRARASVDERDVDIRLGDLVQPVSSEELGTFDVLVSNPPYIPAPVLATLPREVVGYEPRLALDGGADGLDVFRRLVDAAPRVLKPGGLLVCELFEGSLDDAAGMCERAGLMDVRVMSDLAGRPRFIWARTAVDMRGDDADDRGAEDDA